MSVFLDNPQNMWLGLLLLLLCVGPIVFFCMQARLRKLKYNKVQTEYRDWLKKQQSEVSQKIVAVGFNVSKRMSVQTSNYYVVDVTHEVMLDVQTRMLLLADYVSGKYSLVPFTSVLNCEIQTDSFAKTTGSVYGSVNTFGGTQQHVTGSIHGNTNTQSCTNILRMQIKFNDIFNSLFVMDLLQKEIAVNSQNYRYLLTFAQEVESTLNYIAKSNQQ